MRDRRIGNLKDHRLIFADNCEELTCKWRSEISTVLVKNLNKENDNFMSPIDHSPDSELGILQTKGRKYDPINKNWIFTWKRDHHKKFDNMICYCVSEDGKIIKMIYIFPKFELLKITGVTIVGHETTIGRYGTPCIPWYEKYRVINKKSIERINEIWMKLTNIEVMT